VHFRGREPKLVTRALRLARHPTSLRAGRFASSVNCFINFVSPGKQGLRGAAERRSWGQSPVVGALVPSFGPFVVDPNLSCFGVA
jgi:hypothetical protein